MTLGVPTILQITAVLAAMIVLSYLVWRRRHQKTPAERERLRRLGVNATGRLTDGALVESPYGETSPRDSRLLFFRYYVAGVEYTAAQDIAALVDEADAATLRTGTVAAVKYDPRKPSNSIVICEQWTGLPAPKPGRNEPPQRNKLAAKT